MLFLREVSICLISFAIFDFLITFFDKKVNDLSSLPVKVSSEHYNHGYLPLVKAREFWGGKKYNLITNSLGYRDATRKKISKRSELVRFLIVGDSFSEGPGYDYEKTFSGIVSENLSKSAEVLNLSRMNYSPQIYWRKIKHLIEKEQVKIDHLIFMVDPSDPYEEAHIYKYNLDEPLKKLDFSRPRSADFLNEYFYQTYKVARYINRLIRKAKNKGPNVGIFKTVWIEEALKMKKPIEYIGLRKTLDFFSTLKTYLESKGVNLLLVLYPHGNQLIDPNGSRYYEEVVTDWAQKNNVNYLNFYNDLFSGPISERKNFLEVNFEKDLVHLNTSGNKLFATEITNFLKPYLGRLNDI